MGEKVRVQEGASTRPEPEEQNIQQTRDTSAQTTKGHDDLTTLKKRQFLSVVYPG